ncbi:hypothetical protein ABZ249_29975 [Nocardiopsis sp. NPDC006139]|uniref:hypothetical protein n=1 Tax=Nocardiopsis sp. NPDC006139 TaxID=3154578 RepID=UPI0033B41E83
MSFPDTHTAAITNALTSINDPADRARAAGDMLNHIPALQRALREARQEAVLEMRATGATFDEIGKQLGITRARASDIAKGASTAGRKKKTQE